MPSGCRARREGVNKNIVITTDKRLIAATSFIVSSFNPAGPYSTLCTCHASVFLAPTACTSSETHEVGSRAVRAISLVLSALILRFATCFSFLHTLLNCAVIISGYDERRSRLSEKYYTSTKLELQRDLNSKSINN